MFVGESVHNLDNKHRVFIPKRFQDVLERDAKGQLNVVVTRGFERCLFLFSQSGFQTVLARLETQAFGGERLRKMQRLFFANTHRCQLDASGRLVLPEKLRSFAGIQKEVVMVGVAQRAEIWNREDWDQFEAENDGEFDALGTVLCGGSGGSPPEQEPEQ